MTHLASTPAPAALAQLADQWTVLREHYAFLVEALLRLVTDHPEVAPDVIQGAMQNAQDALHKVAAFSEALYAFREQAPTIGIQEDSS